MIYNRKNYKKKNINNKKNINKIGLINNINYIKSNYRN